MLRLLQSAKRELRKQTEEPESMRVLMFLILSDFSKMYRAPEKEGESALVVTALSVAGGLEEDTLLFPGASMGMVISLGRPMHRHQTRSQAPG